MEVRHNTDGKNLYPQIETKPDETMQTVSKYDQKLDLLYIKRQYYKMLRKVYKHYGDILYHKHWNELSLQEHISAVKQLSILINNNKVEVTQENGEDILVVKRNNPKDSIIRILSAEECFPIILKAHIESMHGDAKAIQSITECYYRYPLFCIPFVLQSCKVCKEVTKPFRVIQCKKMVTNKSTWKCMIHKMHRSKTFNYLFIYMEVDTKYTVMRPLTKLSIEELGMELMKIFTTFGPPKKLLITAEYENLLQKALKMLALINSDYMVHVERCKDYIFDFGSVINAFKKWFKQTGTKDWVTGCSILQWQYNTSIRVISQKTKRGQSIKSGVPYNLFFGSEANAFNHITGDIVSEQLNSKSCKGITFDIEDERTDQIVYLSSDESDDDTAELDIVRCCVCNEEFTMYTCSVCTKHLHYKCGRRITAALDSNTTKFVCTNCYVVLK